jgi:hypothetical protein
MAAGLHPPPCVSAALAELPLGALRAGGHDLANVGKENAPDLSALVRASALGAGEVEAIA